MRWIALSLLVAATGCNQVFGLDKTRPVDGGPDVMPGEAAPPDLTITFDYQLGTTDSTGAPAAATALPISPAPSLQIGLIVGGLQAATYDASTKSFTVPFGFAGQSWRTVYTLTYDSVPYEIQWSVKSGHLALPWLERTSDMPPPANSGYSLTPSPVVTLGAPTLVTTGAFTNTPVPNADRTPITGGTRVDFNYAKQAAAVLGPLGTPKSALGDRVLLADWHLASAGIYSVSGYGVVTNADLTGGTLNPYSVPWTTTAKSYSGISFDSVANGNRMNANGIGGLGGTCCSYHLEYGALYNPNILPFLPNRPPLIQTGLDVPLMASFYIADSASVEPTSVTMPDPTASDLPFPPVYFAQYTRPRTTAYGVTLTTAMTEISPASMKNFSFDAPLATGVMFGGVTLMSGSADNQQVPGSTGKLMLTWGAESGSNITVDDYVVTLYEIASNALAPIERYQVTDPKVSVDGALLVAGHRYVFGITSRRGFPNVANNDYSVVQLPFYETTTFPLAFVIN